MIKIVNNVIGTVDHISWPDPADPPETLQANLSCTGIRMQHSWEFALLACAFVLRCVVCLFGGIPLNATGRLLSPPLVVPFSSISYSSTQKHPEAATEAVGAPLYLFVNSTVAQ